MRADTSAWLEPMLNAADLSPEEFQQLMRQASMPAAEVDDAFINWLRVAAPPRSAVRAIDWVRFGDLLRDRIGWHDYPDHPAR